MKLILNRSKLIFNEFDWGTPTPNVDIRTSASNIYPAEVGANVIDEYLGKTVYGISFYSDTGKNVTFCICKKTGNIKNGTLTKGANIKTVVAANNGENRILFDQPVVLAQDEVIGMYSANKDICYYRTHLFTGMPGISADKDSCRFSNPNQPFQNSVGVIYTYFL